MVNLFVLKSLLKIGFYVGFDSNSLLTYCCWKVCDTVEKYGVLWYYPYSTFHSVNKSVNQRGFKMRVLSRKSEMMNDDLLQLAGSSELFEQALIYASSKSDDGVGDLSDILTYILVERSGGNLQNPQLQKVFEANSYTSKVFGKALEKARQS